MLGGLILSPSLPLSLSPSLCRCIPESPAARQATHEAQPFGPLTEKVSRRSSSRWDLGLRERTCTNIQHDPGIDSRKSPT